jgi:hypothetical protein
MNLASHGGSFDAILAGPTFNRESFDPTLLQIAILVGILKADGDQIILNLDWFKDPLTYLQAIPTARRHDLIKTLQRLLGSNAGNALGTPQSALNRLWYPIRYPSGDSATVGQESTGLFIVTNDTGGSPEEDGTVVVGLGLLYPVKQEFVTINPYAYFPLFELSKDQTRIGFGDNPAELGIEISTPNSEPFGSGDVSFTGFKVAASIFFNGQPPGLDLILLNLKMPGQVPADRSLQDLIDKTTVDQWLATGLSAMAGLLAEVTSDEGVKKQIAAITTSILNLLGLTGNLPPVDWQRLIREPDQAKLIFLRWFQQVASSSAKLAGFLNELYLLRNAVLPIAGEEAENVTGTGTRNDPFAIEIIKVARVATVSFTVGTSFDDQKRLHVFPGLRVASAVNPPVAQVAVQIAASAEVADIVLDAAPQGQMNAVIEPTLFPSLSAMAVLTNPISSQPLFKIGNPEQDSLALDQNSNRDLPDDQSAGANYLSVGSAMLGIVYGSLDSSGGPRTLIPTLKLNKISSTYGSWDSVDLTNYDQTLQLLSEGIAAFVAQKLRDFLGDRGGSLAANLGAVLGITPPPNYQGAWPVQNQMLLSSGQLALLIQNPLAALASYYTRCLNASDGEGKPAWRHLLPGFAGLLGGVGTTVSGGGTASDPWQVEMAKLGDNGPVAYLQAWQIASSEASQKALNFSILLSAELSVEQIIITMAARLDLLEAVLPKGDGSGAFGARWLPEVQALLRLNGVDGPLKTRPTAGMNLQADYGLLAAGWNTSQGFHWLATLEGVAIKYASQPQPVRIGNGRLQFSSDSTEWSSDTLGQFAPVILTVAGMALLGNGGRVGLTLACALGLLPALPEVINGNPSPGDPFEIPLGLPLPTGWPTFTITDPVRFFADPWPDLRKQIAALFTPNSRFAMPMLRVLGWGLTGNVPPDRTATGTWDDPWLVRLESVWKLEVVVWSEGSKIGFGLGRTLTEAEMAEVKIAASIRAGLVYLNLGSDANLGSVAASDLLLPRVALTCTLSGKPLLVGTPESALQIGKARFGAYLDQSGVFPVVSLLDTRLSPDQRFPIVELIPVAGKPTFTSNEGMQVMNALVGAVMQRLSDALKASNDFTALSSMLDLLVDLGLVDRVRAPGELETQSYGINVGAWESVLANPPAFLSARMNSVLQDSQKFTDFFNHLSTLMGLSLKLPDALKGMPDLLVSLGLLKRMAGGYTVQLSSWVRLVNNPVAYFNERLSELLNDVKARESLISQLSGWTPPGPPLPKVRFSVVSGVSFRIEISPEDPLNVGTGFNISGEAALDLQTLTFKARGQLFSAVIGSSLTFEYSVGAQATGAWRLVIEGAPGPLPAAFAPLQLYPLPQEDLSGYFKELGLRLPLSILSALTENALSLYLLPQYPVATNIFQAFGLLERAAPDKPYQVKWLLRAFFNPVGWILSPAVLGDGSGGIDLNKLGNWLYTIPGPGGVVGPGGILLKRFETSGPVSKGMELSKLPYGAAIKIASDAQRGVAVSIAADPINEISIAAGLAFGAGNGVAVFGATNLNFAFGPVDDRKELLIKSSFEGAQFGLGFTGKSGSFELPQITLIPFRGLSQYIPDGPQTARLLDFVTGESLKAYDQYKQSGHADPKLVKFVDAVIQFAGYFDVRDASTLMAAFGAIKSDPVKWITGWFDPERTAQTMTALNGLLSDTFGLKGFSIVEQQVLQFAPEIGTDIGSIKVKMGNRRFDGETVFGIWIEPVIKKLFLAARLEAGIGVETPIDVTGPVFRIITESSLSADVKTFAKLNIPLEPRLVLNVDVSTRSGMRSFGVNFYPVQATASPDTLAVMLLPQAALAYGNPPVKTQDSTGWMLDLAVRLFVPLIADMALHTRQVTGWLNGKIGGSEVMPGTVLTSWGLLESKGQSPNVEYLLADLKTAFGDLTFEQIVEKLIYTALSSFPQDFKLLDFKNVTLFIASKTSNQVKSFGIGVSVTNLKVIGGESGGAGKGEARDKPQLLLQLGKWMSEDTDADSWFSRAGGAKNVRPGVVLYLVDLNEGNLSFNASLDMISVGVDFKGSNQKALLDVNGFRVGGIEPRLYFGIDMSAPSAFKLGGGIRVDGLGIPLGPGFFQETGDTNPVAQNLLASRGGGDAERDGNNKDAINPSFSATAGYVTDFDLQFYQDGADGGKTDKVWLSVQRAFGPLQCRRVGVGWKGKPDNVLSVLFDGKVAIAVLSIDMVNLSVGIPVTNLQSFDSYELDLSGLNVTFASGPVLISGGLLKTENPLAYTGQVIVKAQNFMIVGVGSYAELVGNPSMFVFAFASLPIGGPPYFFIKGVAGGFGFNRGLKLPDIEMVQEFPLIKGLAKPEVFGDGTAEAGLEALARDIYPELGSYWLAAGLKFATFELLESTALLFIKFGKDFELSLLGLSILKLPKNAGPKTYVQAELALLVTLKLSEGLIAASAMLTPNSYVIDEKCRLTGGFAFRIWFGPDHKGDFVITIGGYHPIFKRPDHFPVVPRVGFRWPVSSEITVQGGAYFALTPSCVMAGGSLQLSYQSGKLKAWFTAYANFLISWKPFYYDIELGVSIGASYELNLLITKTVTVELSASVHIWGPRMRGKARVSWWVISFTVTFGDGSDQRPGGGVIEWKDFYATFLPQPDKPAEAELSLWGAALPASALAPAPPTPQNVVQISAAQGLQEVQKTNQDSGQVKKGAPWLVRASAFKLATKTAIPATKIILDNGTSKPVLIEGNPVGVRPMGSLSLISRHTIFIEYLSSASPQKINLSDKWNWTADESGVGSALWDTVNDGYETPSAKLLDGRIVGISAGSPKPRQVSGPPEIPLENLAHIPLQPRRLPLSPVRQVSSNAAAEMDSFRVIEDTVMESQVVAFRREIVDAMVDFGFNAEDGRMDLLAAFVASILDAEPMLGPLGEPGPQAQPRASARIILSKPALTVSSAVLQPAALREPQLVAVIRQYSHPTSKAVGERSGFDVRPDSSTSGKTHSLKSFSKKQDELCVKGALQSGAGDDRDNIRRMNLHVGSTLLWDVPVNAEGSHRLRFDGSIPVRVAAFDRNHAWICCQELAASGAEDFELPAGTTRLSLTGLSPQTREQSEQRVFGWHRRSSFIQVNPHANLGEGVIVWTRAPMRIRQGVLSLDHGLSYADWTVATNQVQLEDSLSMPGWIETVVPASVRAITVSLKREDDQPVDASQLAQALEVSVPVNSTAQTGERQALQAQQVMIEGARVNLFYAIPQDEVTPFNELISVLVRTEPGWMQQGVIGTEGEPVSAKEQWSSTTLKSRAAPMAQESEIRTRVEFIY